MISSGDKKILFRADGNNEIGLGHLYRCLAIADRVKDNFETYIAIQSPSEAIIKEATRYAQVIALPVNGNYHKEAEYLAAKVISSLQPFVVVLDGYNFDAGYQQIIKNASALKLVCINDGQAFGSAADVVINHADGISSLEFSQSPGTHIYTGSKYALLRKPFIEQGKKERKIGKIERLFICFGGADTSRVSLKVLRAAVKTALFTEINVVVGSNYNQDNEFKEFIAANNLIQSFSNLGVNQMIGLMKRCELAVVPASTLALECLMCEMIMITGTTADNQQLIHNGLKSLPFVKSIGNFLTVTEAGLTDCIESTVHQFKNFLFTPVLTGDDPILDIFNSLV